MKAEKTGIYIHIPFCEKKCRYCDFASIGRSQWDESSVLSYLNALHREIIPKAEDYGSATIDSIFIGGGTPSILSSLQIKNILDRIKDSFNLDSHSEITMEMNPSSAKCVDFSALSNAGVNRASIGVQSFDDKLLALLGRLHDSREAVEAVRKASCFFPSVSVDLIYGIPGQSRRMWEKELEKAVSLPIDHLSAYELTLDSDTPMGADVKRGVLRLPLEEDVIGMFEDAGRILSGAGLFRYEISNYSRNERQCLHNMKYWQGAPYLGFGSGAASYYNNWRCVNVHDPFLYTNLVMKGFTPLLSAERLSLERRAGEFMMLGLRTTDGVSCESFFRHTGGELEDFFGKTIRELQSRGLLDTVFSESGKIQRVFIPENRLLLQGEIAGEFLQFS